MKKEILIIGEVHPNCLEYIANHLPFLISKAEEKATAAKVIREAECDLIKRYRPDVVFIEDLRRVDIIKASSAIGARVRCYSGAKLYLELADRITSHFISYLKKLASKEEVDVESFSRELDLILTPYEISLLEELVKVRGNRVMAVIGVGHLRNAIQKARELGWEVSSLALRRP
jgi:hypothetical protein